MIANFFKNFRSRVETSLRNRAFRARLFQAAQPILLGFAAFIGFVVFWVLDQTHEAMLSMVESAQDGPAQLYMFCGVLFLFSLLFATAQTSFSRDAADPEALGQASDAKAAERAIELKWNPVVELRIWRRIFWVLAVVTPWLWAFSGVLGADQIIDAHVTALQGVQKAAAEVEALEALRAQLWWSSAYWGVGALFSLCVLWILFRRTPRIIAIAVLLAVGILVTIAPQIAFEQSQSFLIWAGPTASSALALYTVIGALVLLAWVAQVTRQSYAFVLLVVSAAVILPQIDWLNVVHGPAGGAFAIAIGVVMVFFLFGLGEPRWRAVLAVAVIGLGFAVAGVFGVDESETASLERIAKTRAIEGRKQLAYEEDFDRVVMRWLREARQDRGWAPNEPFPVFVLAARGGGSYAAAASATLLARLEQESPGFHRHIFAISGVSGGAVGATIFNDLMNSEALRPGCAALAPSDPPPAALSGQLEPTVFRSRLEAQIAEIIGANHLGAALGALPADIFIKAIRGAAPSHRVRALNRSFVDALRRARPEDDVADGGSCRGLPQLVLNMTSSETGERIAHAPFSLEDVGPLTLQSFRQRQRIYRDRGLRLVDIDLEAKSDDDPRSLKVREALQSATFPLIVPAATYSIQNPENDDKSEGLINFVDGGYSDSSGATTAFDLIRAIEEVVDRFNDRAASEDQKVLADIHLIALNSGLPVSAKSLDEGSGTRLRDIGAITTTVLNLRSLRSQVALRDAVYDLGRERSHLIEIDDELFRFALGWSLSHSTIRSINAIIGDPDFVEDTPSAEKFNYPSTCYAADTLRGSENVRSICAANVIRRNSCTIDRLAGMADRSRRIANPNCVAIDD